MTLQIFATPLTWPVPTLINQGANSPASSTTTLDAVGEYLALIFRAPRTGDISHLEYYVNAVAGASGSAVMDCRVETVSAATGLPSGTLWATNTNGSQTLAFNDDAKWFSTALTANASVTIGDVVALVVKVSSFTTVTNVQLSSYSRSAVTSAYGVADTGTGAAKLGVNIVPQFTVKYSDSPNYVPIYGVFPYKTITTSAITNATGTRRIAAKFQIPAPVRAEGCWAHMIPAASNAFDIVLYAADGTTVLSNISIDTDQLSANNTSAAVNFFTFDTFVDLAANTNYYLSFEPTTGTAITMYDFTAEDNDRLEALCGGKNFMLATHNGTSWTDSNTRTPAIGLIFDKIDDGAGGGGSSANYYTTIL